MTTELGQRLDDLAAFETTGLDLRHPAFPAAVDVDRGAWRPRPSLAMVAAAAIVLVFGGWWLSREPTSKVDVAGGFESAPIPALLLEESTPLSELSANMQDLFANVSLIPPLRELDPTAAPVEFDGVHVVATDVGDVIVGLDTSETVLCLVVAAPGDDTFGTSCGSPATFMMQGVSFNSLTSPAGAETAVFVFDDVVSVEMGSREAAVVRNVATFDVATNDVLRLRRADGTVEAAASIPDLDADGELILSSGSEFELAAVGCAIRADGFLAEGAFTGTDGVLSAVLSPDGVFLTGGVGSGDMIDGVVPNAVVETENIDGALVVTASWDGETPGSLRINCGDRLLDLSELS